MRINFSLRLAPTHLMSRTLSVFLLFLLFSSWCASAQNVPAKARRAYEAAQKAESKHDWVKAERHILKAIKEYSGYTDAYITYGNWLLDRHQYSAAALILTDAERRCANGPKIFQKPLAKSLLYSRNVDEALKRFPLAPKDSFWKSMSRQAANMKELMGQADTSSITPIAPPWRINTADPELFPSVPADGQTFYFTRRVNASDEDFFYAKRDTCDGWFAGINMGSPPNTLQQEAAQFVSADGHYLFFMRCDNRTISGWDQGGCDLFMAYRADSVWSVPQSFGATINSPGYEGMPCLSSDNRELYFVSDREGGYGGLDIWSSRFEHGLWQMPRNLGPQVNTSGNETAPFIYADNNTLFFASTGKPGMGGSDLFMSRRTSDTSWSEALNLGPKVNTPFDETSLSLNAKGDTAYFASDRDSLAGNFDIYQFPLPRPFQPSEVMYLKGCVYDSISKDRLNYASVYITDNETGKDLYQVQSNRGDGSYTIALPVGHSYHFLVDRISYQSITDSMRIDDSLAGRSLTYNIRLLPFDYQKPITDSLASTVFFVKNSIDISDSGKAKITASLMPYKGVAGVTILVNGYTDNSGTPMLNEQLSYTRARLVADFIKASGFPAEIVRSQGWGEANPKADNDTDEHRDMNRRVEIVVRQ
jgi:outer membrane protein OmpA-like peptidoglycan-associated protein